MLKRKFLILFTIFAVASTMLITGCSNDAAKQTTDNTPKATEKAQKTEAPKRAEEAELTVDPAKPQKILVTMENGKTFTIETAPQYAPETVKNFLTLVEADFYDGLTFHRVIDGFVAQGGDPKGNGTGGSSKKIKGEFAQNGFSQNTLKHTRGVISMARSQAMDSASSQFFICYDDVPSLDGAYAGFGSVTEGMETVDEFLTIKRDQAGMPSTPIVIKSMEIVK